jgi:Ca-activated chloride channel family protein
VKRGAGLLLAVALLFGACSREDAAPAASEQASFSILASSEVKDLEPALTDAARAAGVTLKWQFAGALDIVERSNDGEAFDAILPANGPYAALALNDKPLAREKLFYSRVALGVKAPLLKQLGWDRQPPSWADIAKSAGSGRLSYGMTNPASSNSGMSALFAVASAVAGKSEDLAVADVDAVVLTEFLKGHKLTSGSSGWLGDTFAKNPGAVPAMVNYEAVILRKNAELAPADRLTLVYPRDGVISADYPLMLRNAAKRADYDKLVAAFKAKDFQSGAVAQAFLRPSNPEAALAPQLPTAAVAELSFPNRLDVIDAVLGSYLAKWRRPATSIFVLDVSGSMQKDDRIGQMRSALQILAGAQPGKASNRYAAFQQRERVALIAFSDRVQAPVWVDFGGELTAARGQVQAEAERLKPDGGTAIYDALLQAQRLAQQERLKDADRVISIVLLTDGANNKGADFDEFRAQWPQDAAQRTKIFPIVFGESDAEQMRQLAELSGARSFDARKTPLAQVFKEIRGYQ